MEGFYACHGCFDADRAVKFRNHKCEKLMKNTQHSVRFFWNTEQVFQLFKFHISRAFINFSLKFNFATDSNCVTTTALLNCFNCKGCQGFQSTSISTLSKSWHCCGYIELQLKECNLHRNPSTFSYIWNKHLKLFNNFRNSFQIRFATSFAHKTWKRLITTN